MIIKIVSQVLPPYSRRRGLASAILWYGRKSREWYGEARRVGFCDATYRLWIAWKKTREEEQSCVPRTDVPNRYIPVVKRPLRILTYHWHTGYQYELCKLPHQFFMVRGVGLPFNNVWGYDIRPMPSNVCFINASEVRPEEFDLAILPFDETILSPELTCGARPSGWGRCFLWLLEQPIPKVALCHASPPFFGQYDLHCTDSRCPQVMDDERERIVQVLGEMPVVCQSHQSLAEWGFAKPTVIWHGFTPEEFPLREAYHSGVLTLGDMALRVHPYYNGYFLWRNTLELLPKEWRSEGVQTPKPQRRLQSENDYARAKFENYKKVLCSHAVYFNPTLRSPMPFMRTEAMLCGLVPVTTSHHDASQFIRNGVNGFVGDSAEELAEYISYCFRQPQKAFVIGKQARKTAIEVFHTQRFLRDWQNFLEKI